MIDVALGMALLYAVLSLFVTTIQEYLVNSGMRWRSRHMKKMVRSAFGEDEALTDAFFKHPLIVSLADGKGGREPSYVPDDVLAKVFLAVLGHGSHPKEMGLSPAAFMASLRPSLAARRDTPAGAVVPSTRPAGSPLDFIESLRLATTDSADPGGSAADWPAFEAEVARWLGDIGERSRGWFKRSSQRWTFAIALLIAVGLNVDSVMIARTLWGDAELRKQLADAAVVLDTVRTAAAGASAPRASATADTLEERYARVEAALKALEARLKEDDVLQEKSFFTVTCEAAPAATCQKDEVIGDHCLGARPAPQPPSPAQRAECVKVAASRPPANGKKPPQIAPATLWLDQVHDLGQQLAAGRAEATTRGTPLQFDARLQERAALVQRSLAAMASDMALVRLKTPDPKGKASRTMDSLIGDVQTLHAQLGAVFHAAVSFDRAEAECGLQFAKGSNQHVACVHRRQGEQPFALPLGFEPSVLARQMSAAALETCAKDAAGCSTATQWWNAVLNGALLGWLLTAFALSLGAPFWFDTLGRLVKLRASGPPEDGDKSSGADKKKPAAPAPAPAPSAPSTPAAPATSGTSDVASKIESTLSQDEIREVQRKLQVPATGIFDDATRTAIAARRAKLGMGTGAELDGALYEAIIERRSPSVTQRPTLSPKQAHELVPQLRDRLSKMLGIPARAQGSGELYDAKLSAAVQLLQGRAGLAPDGIVGEQTWRVIDAGNGAAVAADAWMSRAISQLGLDETLDKEEVRKFLEVLHLEQLDPASPDAAWCACFVAWVVKDVGPPPPKTDPARALSWNGWGKQIDDDPYGAVVLLRQTKVRAGATPQHHLALMVGKASNGWVVLGGNQGHQGDVSVSLFPSDGYEVVYRGMPNIPTA